MRTTIAVCFVFALTICALPARAALITAGPADDVEAVINALAPGDELVLEAGTYTLTERFSFALTGTQAAPIVIRAADGADVLFHRPDADQNLWDFSGTWVTLRGLRFSGGSAGLRVEGADHLTLEDCEIFDTADVALRMNDSGVTYRGVRILRNHIHDTGGTGEGMYLGCNEDGCRLLDGLIEGNWVHHTNGPTVTQGDGIELKEGSAGNVIRDNVIHDTNYPCILTYATLGNGPANVIERNVLWSCGDHGIQSAADAIIRNNIILGAVGTGIALQPHQSGAPGNQVVVHNTIFNRGGDALAVRNATGDVVVANNAIYAEGGFAIRVVGSDATVVIAGNVGTGGIDGSAQPGLAAGDLALDFVDAHLDDALPLDCFPLEDGALVDAADAAYLAPDDFNGTDRAGSADVGAYRFDDGGNPGWTLADGFKDVTPVSAPACGDSRLDDGEDCDDGNLEAGDGCSPACEFEEIPQPVCGDRVLDDGEECDDGNVIDGDGCSALCRAEGSDEKPAGDDGCGCSHAGGRGPGAPWAALCLIFLGLCVRRVPGVSGRRITSRGV